MIKIFIVRHHFSLECGISLEMCMSLMLKMFEHFK